MPEEQEPYVAEPGPGTQAMLGAGAVAAGDGNLEAQALSLWHAMLAVVIKGGP